MGASGLPRARVATAVLFFATGFVSATWLARIPATQDRLDLSAGELALAVLAIEAGALLGLPSGAALVTRIGSRRCLRLGFAVFPAALLVAVIAPTLGWLAATLTVWAAANSVIDVAMNVQGVELERRYRRPLLSALHAAHSFGVLAGGMLAIAAAAGGVSLRAHAGAVAACTLVAGLVAPGRLVVEPAAAPRHELARPERGLILLGAIAFCAFLIDGSANNWAAVQLRTEHGAGATLAATGFTGFALALAVGRLIGDRLVLRAGRVRVVQAGGALAAAGAALAITAASSGFALAGWALVGAGLAAIAPTVLGATPSATHAPPGVAIAAVTSIGYLGSFTGPPLIGVLAEVSSLSLALSLLVVAALLTALMARRALSTA
jgi:MFS family permease